MRAFMSEPGPLVWYGPWDGGEHREALIAGALDEARAILSATEPWEDGTGGYARTPERLHAHVPGAVAALADAIIQTLDRGAFDILADCPHYQPGNAHDYLQEQTPCAKCRAAGCVERS